jgi:hypothetical protein
MKHYWNVLCWKLMLFFARWANPSPEEICLSLVLYTASLEIPKGTFLDFRPMKGMCGPAKLTGNGLPVFTYTVFEKKIMEFIKVQVEISRPDRINFTSTIDSHTAPERNGEVIECIARYQAPFYELAKNLCRYFPYYPKECKNGFVA